MAALAMGVSLQACAHNAKPGQAASTGMTAAPVKPGGSGIAVQYRIDGTPQARSAVPVVLSFDGVSDPAGGTVKLTADGGLTIVGQGDASWLGVGNFAGLVPNQIVLFLTIAILAEIIVERTRFGRELRLIGMNPSAASVAGLRVQRTLTLAFLVAGTERFDTAVMEVLRERAFVKVGAEGVFCAALPEAGLGIAIKCADGAVRAAEVVMATLLQRSLKLDDTQNLALGRFATPVLRNWNGMEVGRLRAAHALRPA